MQTISIRKTDNHMGYFYAEVELINEVDIALSKNHTIGEEEIKRIHLNILVDTGAFMLTINENIQEVLQLPFKEKMKRTIGHI